MHPPRTTILHGLSVVVLCMCLYGPGIAAGQVNPPTALRYQATMINSGQGSKPEVRVLYDEGKFRIETDYPSLPPGKFDRGIKVYDGTSPRIIWGYGDDTRKTKGAWIQTESIHIQLREEAKRTSVDAVARKYGLPTNYEALSFRAQFRNLIMTTAEVENFPNMKKVRQEKVAGWICDVYEADSSHKGGAEFSSASESGAARRADLKRVDRAHVEPKTGLVLKHEFRAEFPGSPQPPATFGYEVKSFALLSKSPPADKFRLPPGSVANVPRLFQGVKLPTGVKAVPTKGAYTAIGEIVQQSQAVRPSATNQR